MGGTSLLPGTIPDTLIISGPPDAPARGAVVLYSPDIGDLILGLYTEGWSLSKICAQDGMPTLGTLLRWFRDSEKLMGQLDQARRARALLFEDSALETLDEDPGTMAQVAWASKRFDAHMRLAEVNDPIRYGKKVTVGGDKDRPIIFKVVTGVPAPRSAGIELNPDGTIKKSLPDIELAAQGPAGLPFPAEANSGQPSGRGESSEGTGGAVASSPGAAHPMEVAGSSPAQSTS